MIWHNSERRASTRVSTCRLGQKKIGAFSQLVLHTLASICVMCFLMWKCPITHTADGLAGGRKWPLAFSPARGGRQSQIVICMTKVMNYPRTSGTGTDSINTKLGEELVLYLPVTDASFISVAFNKQPPNRRRKLPASATRSRPVLLTCGWENSSARDVSSVPRGAARKWIAWLRRRFGPKFWWPLIPTAAK